MHRIAPLAVAALALFGGSAVAQDHFQRQPGVSVLDLHQMDMNRMRMEADARAAYQREQTLTTRLTRLEIQSRRQPDLVAPTLPPLSLDAPMTSQARREAATAARIQTEGAAGEINQWLDRPPEP